MHRGVPKASPIAAAIPQSRPASIDRDDRSIGRERRCSPMASHNLILANRVRAASRAQEFRLTHDRAGGAEAFAYPNRA